MPLIACVLGLLFCWARAGFGVGLARFYRFLVWFDVLRRLADLVVLVTIWVLGLWLLKWFVFFVILFWVALEFWCFGFWYFLVYLGLGFS